MDQFLKNYKLSRSSKMIHSINMEESRLIIKNIPKKKSPSQMVSLENSSKYLKKN